MNLLSQLRRVLLVVEFKTLDEVRLYREAIKALGLNVHECKILVIVKSKRERNTLDEFASVVYFSPKDYSFLGSIQNDDVTKLFKTKFDTLIQVGEIHKRINKSLHRIKPEIRIGLNVKKTDVFDIALNSDSDSPEHLLEFMKMTLEKIV